MPIEEVNSNRTREQHSADSRKGGIRSGEVRRERAMMKQELEAMLKQTTDDNTTYKNKVTEDQVWSIIKDLIFTNLTNKQIGEKYNVSDGMPEDFYTNIFDQ